MAQTIKIGLAGSIELKQKAPHLAKQLDAILNIQKSNHEIRFGKSKQTDRIFDWVEEFTMQFLLSRIKRADELSEKNVTQARKLAKQFIGDRNHFMFVGCMDGRNIPIVMFSHIPHLGGVMRTQAGELFGFAEGIKPQSILINSDSFQVENIIKIITNYPKAKIYEFMDSHIGCAARGAIYKNSGLNDSDNGLRADILRKMTMARGFSQIREEIAAQDPFVAEIIPQFYSYDPHDGTITMGLELYAQKVELGFTSDEMAKLRKEERIINTWDFLKDSEIAAILKSKVQSVDFRKSFSKSLLHNWSAIWTLYNHGKGAVFQNIVKKLYKIYRLGNWKIGSIDNIDKQCVSTSTLNSKAKLILKNLVTRWSIAQDQHSWPYDRHIEQAIVLTEGGYGPFDGVDVFSVFSKEDISSLLDHVYLSISLIRDFRKNSGIKDLMNKLEGADFVAAPVLIFNKAIVRSIDDATWELLTKLDLTRVFSGVDWNDEGVKKWSKGEILELMRQGFMENKVSLDGAHLLAFVDAVYELFDRVRNMMFDYRFRSLLIGGNIQVLNIITDADRKGRFLLPLIV